MSANKKKYLAEGQVPDWCPWATVSFPTPEARDRFLISVFATLEAGWGAEPKPADDCCASVRWRAGKFLRLNDMAYSHGGRIIRADVPHFRR